MVNQECTVVQRDIQKERKISINVDLYNAMLLQHLSDYLGQLNHQSVTKLVAKSIKHYQHLFGGNLQTIINKVSQKEMEIATLDAELFHSVTYLEHKLEQHNFKIYQLSKHHIS